MKQTFMPELCWALRNPGSHLNLQYLSEVGITPTAQHSPAFYSESGHCAQLFVANLLLNPLVRE